LSSSNQFAIVSALSTSNAPCFSSASASVSPSDELEHEKAEAVDVIERVDGGNARMVERRYCLRFALEARDTIGVGGVLDREDLDRDLAIQLRVTGSIDLAHAAGTKQPDDLMSAELRAGSEGHGGSLPEVPPCSDHPGRGPHARRHSVLTAQGPSR
jgi:hypothetical protein